MVDHGTITGVTPPSPPPPAPLSTFPTAGTYLVEEGMTLGYLQPTGVTRPSPPPPISPKTMPVAGLYAIGGTLDTGYHPPHIGQLWPRGDLDALEAERH